jgi:hypothetical protein
MRVPSRVRAREGRAEASLLTDHTASAVLLQPVGSWGRLECYAAKEDFLGERDEQEVRRSRGWMQAGVRADFEPGRVQTYRLGGLETVLRQRTASGIGALCR